MPKEDEPKKGLKGLNREVFQLTGGNPEPASSAATSAAVPRFQKKRKGASKQVHWEWVGFSNSARTDGLELKHWQKKGVQWEDYPFARFNKKLELLEYSEEEYEKLLSSEDWTRDDTDKLIDLVKRFDMNFFIVQDRWPGSHSVEVLKDRFYFIQRKLTEERGLVAPEDNGENVLMTKPYDREHEEKRKQHLERSMAGSRDEEKEEQEILEKARKIEALLKKRRGEHKKLKPLDPGPRCAKGGVTLRSKLLLRGTESSCVSKILSGIGASVTVCCEQTEEKFRSLADDIAKLLSIHRKLLKRKAKPAKSGPGQPGKPGRKRKHPLPEDEGSGSEVTQKKRKQ